MASTKAQLLCNETNVFDLTNFKHPWCAYPNSYPGHFAIHSKTKYRPSKLKSLPKKIHKAHTKSNHEMNRTRSNLTGTILEHIVVSNTYHGDLFSVQDLAHLPIISSNAQLYVTGQASKDAKLSPISPKLCNLQTPEKRPGRDSNSSGNVSRRSWGFASCMPSPSKLFFSPNKHALSPSIMSPPKSLGEKCCCCKLLDLKTVCICLSATLYADLHNQNWQEFSEMMSPRQDEVTFEAEQFACRILSFDDVEFAGDETNCDTVEDRTKTTSDVQMRDCFAISLQIF
jgi:hypothetical protein